MKYKVTFSVTDIYPTVEVEAKDRDEAVLLYRNMWKDGKLTSDGITKDASWRVVSHREAYKPKGS